MKMISEDHLETQPFLQKYLSFDNKVMEFFDYPINNEGLLDRLKELSSRSYPRKELVEALITFNKEFTDSPSTFEQIECLKNSESVVVVGGQQAGLLTGPIYTINKILSILQEAKRIEKKLNVPVVPLFWIAGEDHDIDEVNHVHVHNGSFVKKFLLHALFSRRSRRPPLLRENVFSR